MSRKPTQSTNRLPSPVGRKVKIYCVGELAVHNGFEATVEFELADEKLKWCVKPDDLSKLPPHIKVNFYQMEGVFERDKIKKVEGGNMYHEEKPVNLGNGYECMIFPQNGVQVNLYDIDYPRYVFDTNITDSPFAYAQFMVPVFTPKPDPDGNVRYWGLQPMTPKDRYSLDNTLKLHSRPPLGDTGYGNAKQLPERQLIEKLVDRRLKAIKANKAAREPYYKYSYEVRIQLNGVYPEVFREVKVSGSMALRTFADKVILPAMGWRRSYHCYYFTDVKDGSNYGQNMDVTERLVDSMFTSLHGFVFVDDAKVRLGDLLSSPGDVLEFIYDLGVRWSHTITVTSAKPYTAAQSSSGRFSHCTILYGEGER